MQAMDTSSHSIPLFNCHPAIQWYVVWAPDIIIKEIK